MSLNEVLMYISGENLKVIESAVQTLYWITASPEGAQAAMDANVLECAVNRLLWLNEEVRKWTWYILEELACHKSTVRAAVECLLSLLR
jgi:hypothetical protein